MFACPSSNMQKRAHILWMQQRFSHSTSRVSEDHIRQAEVIFSKMIASVSLLLIAISHLCLWSTGIKQGADDISQGDANPACLNSKLHYPQTRTLICWASKYFEVWLAKKDESDTMISINSRGWKSEIILDFFQIKDQVFQQQYLDFENPALGV